MVYFRIPKTWELPESTVTNQSAFWNRRQVLKTLFGASLLPLIGCAQEDTEHPPQLAGAHIVDLSAARNPAFAQVDRPTTNRAVAASYNNFYEFGGTKSIWQNAQALPLENWKVEVTGLVNKPRTYDVDTLKREFPLEERIYRFRCVEAWSMVLPWIGFPMNALIQAVEPTAQAKYVQFMSYYDTKVTPGPLLTGLLRPLPWPYTEGLRIEEMANELAFFALGIYGQTLPKQHGAPIRAVLPWKYGFKGAKSIVKIEFTDQQPATYWNTLVPAEYDFEANVNPRQPHPRWSQATERFIGAQSQLTWERKETLLFNGYAEYVARLYA
ncbi:mononuclear molybdenum enzyme YedY [Leptolyngbya sp. 'hensonii']|uniref:protein-methionine-sulfoxide reductase catalytic subunit MsrP n=1 Tax=Leptolyngbya sp. 'hensonii' TaxID=1922337 RepID=UPI00094FC280|nr:protein-methionine-sulfoxide reductase catalytic subunit MsrP [Leptolyngbya sp. 'hensonii']OLP19456.1 mononuclear molybdenum enzyme YedY [Leptolyngbya sp. 'hensonii']